MSQMCGKVGSGTRADHPLGSYGSRKAGIERTHTAPVEQREPTVTIVGRMRQVDRFVRFARLFRTRASGTFAAVSTNVQSLIGLRAPGAFARESPASVKEL